MSIINKLINQILSGKSDANIKFEDSCRIMEYFGFEQRIKGSHHIFTKKGIEEIINIQPSENLTKIYQVKQIRNLILKYKLIEDK